MKIIYQSPFQQIKHDSLLRYFEIAWANTELMTEEEYKVEMQAQIDTGVKQKVYRYVVDSSQFYFTISPKIQEWTMGLFAKLTNENPRKIAFLVTPDIFAQVSVGQKMDEDGTQLFQSRYFESMETAKEWLTRDVKIF